MPKSFTTAQAMHKTRHGAMIYWRALRFSLLMFLGTLAGTVSASAQACAPSLAVLTNGTTADADPVNGNFSTLLGCANSAAPLSNPHFTGNVGIGTSSPSQLLVVQGDVNNFAGIQVANIHGSGSGGVMLVSNEGPLGNLRVFDSGTPHSGLNLPSSIQLMSSGSSGMVVGNTSSVSTATLSFATNNAVQMMIDTGGQVGIGTQAPTKTLFVNGTAGGTSTWSSTSDARLKKNIVPIEDALSIVGQLQGVRFDWRERAERSVGRDLKLPVAEPQIGFIAQDVQKILPEAVSVSRDGEKLMSVQESKILPVLVEAVKKLAAMNQRQSAEIQNLKQRIDHLEHTESRTAQNRSLDIH